MTRSRKAGKSAATGRMRARASTNTVNVLFTCIGRRVSLLEGFRNAASRLRIKAAFLGTDTDILSPALQLCDQGFLVDKTSHPDYLDQILGIVRDNKVRLLVPTVDLDLKILAENRAEFDKLGCRILVSSPQVIDICQDKRKTYRFLLKNGFDTPKTESVSAVLKARKVIWPRFLKPWDGYASRGNAVVNNRRELQFFATRVPNAICQSFIRGQEFTCDAYVDFQMKVRCVVPRMRIEVRAGEVSKGRTVKNRQLMESSAELVEKLGAGPGLITLQMFVTPQETVKFIEINPRFGGGAPLSIEAGADFPKWILQELTGRKPSIAFDGFTDGLTMLRYDHAVWLQNEPRDRGRP